jgi:heme/copper-type cytochrome/quinol oxidase subunit 3
MVRRILFEILLFLLPFGLYAAYLKLSKYDSERPTHQHPWTVLFVSGLVLVAASFVVWGVTEGAGQQGTYVPPHVENGRVVPGHVDPGGAR